MERKIISVLTLLAFLVFSFSCVSHTIVKKDVRNASLSKEKGIKIVRVLMNNGEYIEFPKGNPASISGDSIKGETIVETELEINRSELKSFRKGMLNEPTEITTKDGKKYEAISYQEREDKIIITEMYQPISIPLNQIRTVWIRKTRAGAGMYILGGLAIVGLIVAIASSSQPSPTTTSEESCPFIYSFDGNNYVFDAEPYGGAICQSLKRAEWCGLEHIQETNGSYKIIIANELDETQFTDEVKLIVVDHPQDSIVAPDPSGKFHSLQNLISPLKAVDDKGNDLGPLISKEDGKFWETEVEKKDPERKEDLRDNLIIEFPKPKAAKKVKLFVNASTSLWGSQIAKQLLKLHGNKINEWYEEINSFGPAYQNIINWFFNGELYLLKIWIKTDNGWKAKGMIFGGGPFISENKVYVLDISDVSDDTLKIKLSPPATFWRINSLLVDYSEDLELHPQEISPIKAFSQNGQNVLVSLLYNDNNYLVMPNKGDRTDVLFPVPFRENDLKRSVFVKAVGYYNIHLKPEGKPQTELLEKFRSQPDFTIKFALKAYQKSKGRIRAERH